MLERNETSQLIGVAIEPATAPRSEKASPRVAGQVVGRGAETPKKRCENDPWWWWHVQVRNTRTNHWSGELGMEQNRWRMIMHGTISSIWRTNVCVSGGTSIYRPASFKTKVENDSNITRTSQPTRSQPVECVELITCCELVTQNACSWRSRSDWLCWWMTSGTPWFLALPYTQATSNWFKLFSHESMPRDGKMLHPSTSQLKKLYECS